MPGTPYFYTLDDLDFDDLVSAGNEFDDFASLAQLSVLPSSVYADIYKYYILTSDELDVLDDFGFNTLLLYDNDTTQGVVVLYRYGDAESYEFAQYYQAKKNLEDDALIAVPCSTDEILATYEDFVEQVEGPLMDQLSNRLGVEYGYNTIRYIICGYNVPGGFYDGADVIASTSRLSRINVAFNKKDQNPLFAPAVYNTYSLFDAQQVVISSRIDAPTLAQAKAIVDNSVSVARQGFANGKFYFDKFSVITPDRQTYQDILSDFEEVVLPSLNMQTFKTYKWDDYTDVPLFRLKDDSIVWAFEADRAGYNYFQPTKYSRAFCYNADADGAFSIKDTTTKRWPMLALLSGYAATAGAMSDPTTEGYLVPTPFFDALLQGSTVGEAFIRSVPFLDWTVGLFGDPLLRFKFPQGPTKSNVVSEIRSLTDISEKIANSIAFSYNRASSFDGVVNILLGYNEFDIKTKLFPTAHNMAGKANSKETTYYPDLVKSFFRLGPQLDTQLTDNDEKISSILQETIEAETISSSNLYNSGDWHVDQVISRSGSGFFKYHFEAEFSFDSDFGTTFLVLDSETSQDGWYYEKVQDIFIDLPSTGVASNFAGRRIRYIGSSLISRGTIYYVRIRQRDDYGQRTEWENHTKVGNT